MTNKILYHASCFDGFGAAYAAWKHFKNDAEYIPMYYNQPLPETKKGDTIYLLDYSRPLKELSKLWDKGIRIEVHDHHKSAKEDYERDRRSIENIGKFRFNFNLEKSGAVLAWERFHPGTEIPLILQHIQDRDLWKFKMDWTKEIHAALCSYKFDFKIWDTFITWIEVDGPDFVNARGEDTTYSKLVDKGINILEYHDILTDTICGQAELTNIAGFKVPLVNTCLLFSEVPKKLLDLFPDAKFAAYRYFRKGGIVQYGLRGRGDFDVSEVAKQFGGGGHHDAAGFEISEKYERELTLCNTL